MAPLNFCRRVGYHLKLLSGLLLEDGQGLTEYVFILSAVVMIVAGMLALVGPIVSALYIEANNRFN